MFALSAAVATPLMFAQSSYAAGGNVFEIENQTTGLCLTDPGSGGVQVTLEPCTGFANQEWAIFPTINNNWLIESQQSPFYCLDAPVNVNFGVVDTFPCDGISNENWFPNVSPPSQDQNIVSLVGGIGATHRCLDVSHGNIVAGGVVGLYRCFGGTDNGAQLWTTVAESS
ncbi:MAG TPA: ricin-type beta-trefoil lectin domain protein [Streptosporangiaceae bacterium]|nr:ricin-type beta-trefoil lectin domain protein [Streptosporangiaceae bacterium]